MDTVTVIKNYKDFREDFNTPLGSTPLGKSLLVKCIPVWLRNRLLSAGLEPVLSQTEKAFIASNCRQFLRISNKNHKIKTQFCQPGPSAPRG